MIIDYDQMNPDLREIFSLLQLFISFIFQGCDYQFLLQAACI